MCFNMSCEKKLNLVINVYVSIGLLLQYYKIKYRGFTFYLGLNVKNSTSILIIEYIYNNNNNYI